MKKLNHIKQTTHAIFIVFPGDPDTDWTPGQLNITLLVEVHHVIQNLHTHTMQASLLVQTNITIKRTCN